MKLNPFRRPLSSQMRLWLPLTALYFLPLVWLVGCAAQFKHRQGLELLDQGKSVAAIEALRRANALELENLRYRVDYLNQRNSAVQALVASADDERLAGRLDAAVQRYREAVCIEPGNERVRSGLQSLEVERRAGIQPLNVDRLTQANPAEPVLELHSALAT